MNNENKNKEATSLLARLYAKYHNTNIFKKIAGLAVASSMLVSLVGCNVNDFISTSTDYTGTNQPPTHQTNSSNKETNSSEHTNKTEDHPASEKPTLNISQYSEMLQNVLTDEYYNHIIKTARAGDSSLYNLGIFKSHPYAFLDDEGYDVDAIKNGSIKCASSSFIPVQEPNNLYIYCYVESNGVKPYYTCYLLKYKLSDQEVKDYNLMHSEFYIQSFFLNNEISETREPEIVSETKILVESLDTLKKALRSSSNAKALLKNHDVSGTLLTDFSVENGTFEVLVTTSFGATQSMVSSGYVNTINLKNGSDIVRVNADGAMCNSTAYSKFSFAEEQNSPISVIQYQPSNDIMNKTKFLDIENNQ